MRHFIENQRQPDELGWRLQVRSDGRLVVSANSCDVIHVKEDGIIGIVARDVILKQLGLTKAQGASWNTNVGELKNHYGKLVTVFLRDRGLLDRMRTGFLRDRNESGLWTLESSGGYETTAVESNIEKFCVHELPEDN